MIYSAIQPLVRVVVYAAITAATLLLLGFAMQFVAAALIGIVVAQMLRSWYRHETTINVPPAQVTPDPPVSEGFFPHPGVTVLEVVTHRSPNGPPTVNRPG